MSRRRSRNRRHQRAMQRAGVLSWAEAPPLLMAALIAPVVAGFDARVRLQTCVHLDGLDDIDQLGPRGAVWSPSVVRSLTCPACHDAVLRELAEQDGDETVLPCDNCGQLQKALVTYSSAIEDPNGKVTVVGRYCVPCLTPQEAA